MPQIGKTSHPLTEQQPEGQDEPSQLEQTPETQVWPVAQLGPEPQAH
jgi:hypothetical protein